MTELDKFIKVIPGPERKVYSVDLHNLTYAFQTDHHHKEDLNSGDESVDSKGVAKGLTTGAGVSSGLRGPPPGEGGGGDSGGIG